MAQKTGSEPDNGMFSAADIDEMFNYHKADDDQIVRMTKVRYAATNLALAVVANCPPSADRAAAIRKIREATMIANASIIFNGRF